MHEPASYYIPLGGGRYQPTRHTQGAWNPDEQHMGPVAGLMAHAIDTHEPRPGMLLCRINYEILGMILAERNHIEVQTIRPGRTIELVEATLSVQDQPVIRARAWRLAAHDTAAVAGGSPEPIPGPDDMPEWLGTGVWGGGYIASLDFRAAAANRPGRGQAWIRSRVGLVEGVESSDTARFVTLLDTANGIATRQDPRDWLYPNVDLGIHLHRQPRAGWVGFDTSVAFGPAGLGVTSSTVYDVDGAVGRVEQMLTVRPTPSPGS
ncbi:MAG TPA: thioesterase family protein [Candidatus Lustribacter sp.]|nr:thioesterase family protein [Candidatus Lustribacter sp.]